MGGGHPLVVLVNVFRGGVGSAFSIGGCSSSCTFPLPFVLGDSITFLALLVLAALPVPDLTNPGNILS